MATKLPEQANVTDSDGEKGSDAFSNLVHATVELYEPLVSDKFFADPKTAMVSPSLEHVQAQMDMDNPVELELVEVTRFPHIKTRVSANAREPFSLLFCGSHEQPLISAIYTVTHSSVPDLNIFLNPVQSSIEYPPGEDPEGLFYEACFT